MKRVKQYMIEQDIPSNATFLCRKDLIFFYEVPDAKKAKRQQKTVADTQEDVAEIIYYLNSRTGKNFLSTTPDTRKLITKWINQSFEVSDFLTAIDNMVAAWGDDPKMCKFLRPSTLFGGKFEGYVNHGSTTTEDDVFAELDNVLEGIK